MKKSLLIVVAVALFSTCVNADMMFTDTYKSSAEVDSTYITLFNGGSATNFGSDPLLQVDSLNNEGAKALIKFPTITIPGGATLDSATLSVKANGSTNDVLSLHKVLTSWAENVVTWNSFNSGGVEGVDYDPAFTMTTVPFNAGSTQTFDVTSLVAGWLSTPASNNGIIITNPLATSTSDGIDFHSDDASGMMGPMLEINYTAIPEPTAFLMLGLVGLGFGGNRWWKSRKVAK